MMLRLGALGELREEPSLWRLRLGSSRGSGRFRLGLRLRFWLLFVAMAAVVVVFGVDALLLVAFSPYRGIERTAGTISLGARKIPLNNPQP
jgi:hypothetical protein